MRTFLSGTRNVLKFKMGIFKEIPPTAGFPIHFKDFFCLSQPGSLEENFKKYLGIDYVRITYSGTAALYLILESLKKLSPKTTVIIPSYVCPLVALAIKRAGLKIEVCDICQDSFDFDLNNLENLCSNNQDILAIVAVHLAGIPLDFAPLEKLIKQHGIFIIEDCAQALGAEYHGKKVGTLGDFSFFSLCRGKGLTIYEGGVMVTPKKEYAGILEQTLNSRVKNNFFSESLKIWELFGYSIFYRPFLFWFVFGLPQIFWNLSNNKVRAMAEYFNVDFGLHRVSWFRKAVGHANFYRLDERINKQRDKAAIYLVGLKEIKGIKAIQESPGRRATYPYLTLIFDDAKRCQEARQLFLHSGLGVSWIYGYAICDYDYLKSIIPEHNCANGRFLAERHLTLSTSTFLENKDLELVLKVLRNLSAFAQKTPRVNTGMNADSQRFRLRYFIAPADPP